MKIDDIDKLVPGKHYEIVALECDRDKPWINEEKTYIAEYRGPDIEMFYLLFWIKGDSKAVPFYYKDIFHFKPYQINKNKGEPSNDY